MAKKRKRHTNEEKVNILRKHFIEKIPLSDICDQYGIKLTYFHLKQNRTTRLRLRSTTEQLGH